MPTSAASDRILKRQSQSRQVRQRLAIDRWPLPVNLLPADATLVGGAIRDALLNRLPEQPDLDLIVSADALALTCRLSRELGGSCVVLDETRDIARLVLRGWTIDIARREGSSLEEDLWRRDYRLNAIGLPLEANGQLVDPTGGLEDLAQGQLRAISEENLRADPLRLLRGLRLLAQIPLSLEATTARWIHDLRHRLNEAAPERILTELQKLVAGSCADAALQQMLQLDLITPWAAREPLPCQADAEGFSDAEQALALPLARLCGLISDAGLTQLRASRALQQRCQRLRHWRQRVGSDGEQLGEVDRLQLQLDLEADLPALILQLKPATQAGWLQRWRNPDDPLFHPRFPLDGGTVMKALSAPPGPRIGMLLAHLRQETAFGRLQTKDQALEEARRWWSQTSNAL